MIQLATRSEMQKTKRRTGSWSLNKMRREFSSLLNEHWKRKQRLKPQAKLSSQGIKSPGANSLAGEIHQLAASQNPDPNSQKKKKKKPREFSHRLESEEEKQKISSGSQIEGSKARVEFVANLNLDQVAANLSDRVNGSKHRKTSSRRQRKVSKNLPAPMLPTRLISGFHSPAAHLLLCCLLLTIASATTSLLSAASQAPMQSDPRPTIYSGQVSFGLLLSAHSSLGAELPTSAAAAASSRVLSLSLPPEDHEPQAATTTAAIATSAPSANATTTSASSEQKNEAETSGTNERDLILAAASSLSPVQVAASFRLEPQYQLESNSMEETRAETRESRIEASDDDERENDDSRHSIGRRQIFQNAQYRRQPQGTGSGGGGRSAGATTSGQQSQGSSLQQTTAGSSNQDPGICSQVNANALYAGMGAIWASHQANLVGDSDLAIGTYVYDSCNELDVGQRQSVRIVSNLNAFQQTTCESPRGSPISLTIAHGDNQLRAIQLLTSFRVPVVTTKEHFALEDYNLLKADQKRFLFSTAPSSRHLAMGALRFGRRLVARSISSPKFPNQFYSSSPKNMLIIISRNLPSKFIAYLTEMIAGMNFEILQSYQPIDQIRSVEAVESIMIKSAASESKLVMSRLPPATSGGNRSSRRRKRSQMDDSDSGADSDSGSDDPDSTRMLSPTILMFITPSEAIDLVTRLRNDLAEVSRYYSLIVTTREDISPALKTIFHRGGSRLCSGKAFYTISPRPDDIGEFSRYFRDTVQMEGESSDHPLICEFAKYQATSKMSADLDDISTEPVIKAVWSAAAAFKSVYRRECGGLFAASGSSTSGPSSTSSGGGNVYRSPGQEPDGARLGSTSGSARTINSRQSAAGGGGNNKAAHSECLAKMNKNMSNLVQRALKRLDVSINSTGLQSLDGFRLKFDEFNELMTNKFSIKYINKECEIAEIGQFTGFDKSHLQIDELTLTKALEGSMPDPWPVRAQPPPAPPTQAPVVTTTKAAATADKDNGGKESAASSAKDSAGDPEVMGSSSSRRKEKRGEAPDDLSPGRLAGDEQADEMPPGESSESSAQEPPKRNRKRSKPSDESGKAKLLRNNKLDSASDPSTTTNKKSSRQLIAAPVTAMGGRGYLPGLTDTEERRSGLGSSTTAQPTTTTTTTTSTATPSSTSQRPLKAFPSPQGTTLKDWLPAGETLATATTKLTALETSSSTSEHQAANMRTTRTPRFLAEDAPLNDKVKSEVYVTEGPSRTTLPESDGNADLDPPAKPSRVAKSTGGFKLSQALETAAQTQSADYVTAPTISHYDKYLGQRQTYPLSYNQPTAPISNLVNLTHRSVNSAQFNLNDLNAAPVPLPPGASSSRGSPEDLLRHSADEQVAESKNGRSRLRSHMKWIYSSWYALSILGANILGALLTLYVLTFLMMKNCDGSLDRDNQGIRSMHLLAIIVVFFGSTLFIVYPTPGLCLLRTSWHNFALVMLFGSLLLQAMQTRSLNSLGLGGRPNRLNQFLTLLFMVGVQVAFELQRWKYESANYLNFVNQYFGSSSATDDKKLMILNSAISDQFNPLNSFNDQVTPVSIQVSEHYQNLLQDYCMQQADDFLQSQFYLCLIVGLLVVFSASNRRKRRLSGVSSTNHKLTSTLTSGKLVASQHEANLNLSPSHFQFASNSVNAGADMGNMFMVTIISAFTYSISIVLHIYGQNAANTDLISSVTMVLVAFTALIGIFLPILLQIHRYSSLSAADHLTGSSSSRPSINQSKLQDSNGLNYSGSSGSNSNNNNINSPLSPTNAFTMFPEFAATGLRRPASVSGDSSSGAGSRRMFAETKESRRNMGAALANLGPSADSLRGMGFYNAENRIRHEPTASGNTATTDSSALDPSLLNIKLNLSAIDEPTPMTTDNVDQHLGRLHAHQHNHNHHHHNHQPTTARRNSKGEKRLIMLDVDPCCPRHGVGAWPRIEEHSPASSSNDKKGRTKQSHSKK